MAEAHLTEWGHDDFLAFVKSARWRFAKTMPDMPHEYTLREWNPGPRFNAAVMFIRQNGYQQKFGGRTYTYYDADGHQYWTMGMPVEGTKLINRAEV